MRKLFPMLSCADLSRSVDLYAGLLGATETYRYPAEGEPVFVTLMVGATSEIGLGALSGEPVHGLAQRPASGHRIELCVYVDDVDATHARAEQRGDAVVTAPMDTPWGERIAWVADLDGNLVMLTGNP